MLRENLPVSAVICELNPLHFGHRALLRQARGEGLLVVILSGNFVQRGEPAILDKWARTRLALGAGADLVIELPLPWAMAGAQRFARGGAALAQALGCVDRLVFGSEIADADRIQTAAKALLSPAFSAALANSPEPGEPFARRRERALGELLGEEEAALLRQPNANLGVEYCKALLELGSDIQPVPVLRRGAGHDAPAKDGELLSGGALRQKILAGESLEGLAPEGTLKILEELSRQGKAPVRLDFLERAILCKLRGMGEEDFARLPDLSEGIQHRLSKAVREAGSLEELYALVKNKRVSHARVRRLVLGAFLGLEEDLPKLPPYLRLLGMRRGAEGLLASATLPVLSRASQLAARGTDCDSRKIARLEAAADDLYAMACPRPQPCGRTWREALAVEG